MSVPEAGPAVVLAQLCAQFLASDPDAQGWAFLFPDESHWESPDCDVMSERFLEFAKAAGFDGVLVRAESVDEGDHWFTVIQMHASDEPVAVDWTARQFHNAGHPAAPTDPHLIPCPLVFPWPGEYPIEAVTFQRMAHSRPPVRAA